MQAFLGSICKQIILHLQSTRGENVEEKNKIKCWHFQEFQRFEYWMGQLVAKTADVEELTGCRKNCRFHKYEVIQQINFWNKEDTWIRITPASSTVIVREEKLRIQFINLVAEIGGILGLFVGFSFLMILDKIEKVVTYVRNKL